MDNIAITIKAVQTEEDYKKALETMRLLWGSPENSADADLLQVLSMHVEDYEKKHFVIEPLDPIEAIKYEMEKVFSKRIWSNFSAAKKGSQKF